MHGEFYEMQRLEGRNTPPAIRSSNSSKYVYTFRSFWHISGSFVCQIAFDGQRVHSITATKKAKLTTHQNAFLDH